jgi:glycerol-3-phosphate cytidylyltransferase
MITVITYGTFDLFHIGHLNLLRRAKDLGDRLVVGVSTDEFNALKGKRSVVPFAHRADIVRSIRFVDEVVGESAWEQKEVDIKLLGIDVFTMGDDWYGKFDFLKPLVEVVYLPRTDGVSSTQLKSTFASFVPPVLVSREQGTRREAVSSRRQSIVPV